ncbi:hypothetical protein FHU41_000780 [Psychromicrobium silvestre]|uniref:GmrSD restriction endonucleases C-terminal domain-containing protein n=1 Tax=Psychromicrobium silvestre TaxID=1645614 RepID=A0A7Y9LS27_9MICC|nr:HNH endonuclease family protein [Psychromicrobium silvestre]NYE94559.1 hypothetical protein [Psychromicrobium silvestre]
MHIHQAKTPRELSKQASLTGLVIVTCLVFLSTAVLSWWTVADSAVRWQAASAAPVIVKAIAEGGARPLFAIEPTTALALLQRLAVKDRAPSRGYRREAFGEAWYDLDHNGCDTRNDVLRRDLQSPASVRGSPCQIASGLLHDPYTAKDIDFQRGAETSSAVQIDHLVSLSDAWQKGAQQLTEAQRLSLANDPLNLLAVDGPQNVEKGASDAAEWLPPQENFRCNYVARQISVKAAYGLWLSQAEKTAMLKVLSSCPQQMSWKAA